MTVQMMVGEAGATIDTPTMTMVIPEGALAEDTMIRISEASSGSYYFDEDVASHGPVLLFEPAGLVFLDEVRAHPFAGISGMKIKTFTLVFDPQAGEFDDSELTHFLAQRDVLSVHEYFFEVGAAPYWAIMVGYRDLMRAGEREPAAETRTDWRSEVADDSKSLFDALRKYRNEKAKRDGRAPYVLLTNRQMAEVARRRPETAEALRAIEARYSPRNRERALAEPAP